ncbi:hypothetical protein Tco_1156915 [Tanacetum coccineum]
MSCLLVHTALYEYRGTTELSHAINATAKMSATKTTDNAAKNDATKCWPSNCRTTGGRTGRGSRRTRGRTGDQGNGGIDEQSGQVGGQGNEVNDGVDGVLDFSTIIAQYEKDELTSSVGLDDTQMYSGHLEAKRLP